MRGVGGAQLSAESCLENKECLVLTCAASWKRGLPRMGVWVWGTVVCEHCEQSRDGKVDLDMDLVLPCTLKSLIHRRASTCVRNKNIVHAMSLSVRGS